MNILDCGVFDSHEMDQNNEARLDYWHHNILKSTRKSEIQAGYYVNCQNADFSVYFMASFSVIPGLIHMEQKTVPKSNVFTVSTFEVRSVYFLVKMSKSEDNIQKNMCDVTAVYV